MEAMVVYRKDAQAKEVAPGVQRWVLAYNKDMMVVEMSFEAGCKMPVHSHPHTQSSCVKSGKFRFEAEGKPIEVTEGDTINFPSGIEHCVTCLEAGRVLEIFSPMREDFL